MTMRWDGYRVVQGVVCPARIRLDAPVGSITVFLDDPVFNDELPAGAFDPPARAVRQP